MIAEACTPSQTSFACYINDAADKKKLPGLKRKIGKAIFMECDEGHKKGLRHFVKFISYLDLEETRFKSNYLTAKPQKISPRTMPLSSTSL